MQLKDTKEIFEFLNSPLWLKYTQETYKTPEEIRYRIKDQNEIAQKWKNLETQIVALRKTNSIPLFVDSLEKKFWFYLSDCINKKASELEKKGIQLHQKITQNQNFREDFFTDATLEEAITSAIYEGANSTRGKAQELITSGNAPKNKDEWMLVNNYQAMTWIKKRKNQKISHELIQELHAIVTKNTLEEDDINFSGKYRNDRVFVRSSKNEIKHEGIEFQLIQNAIDEMISLTMKNSRYIPPVIRGILLHYFIAYIHPFFDGNGRTARALFYFKAMRNNLSFVELLSVSAFLKSHGLQYERSFEKVATNDLDITYFIDFNLDALLSAIGKVEKKVDFLLTINDLKKMLGLTENQIGLLQRLALNKFIKVDIEGYATRINMSREIARRELKQLADLSLLKEIREGKKFIYQIDREQLDKRLFENMAS